MLIPIWQSCQRAIVHRGTTLFGFNAYLSPFFSVCGVSPDYMRELSQVSVVDPDSLSESISVYNLFRFVVL
jgi:hypothetical protein